EIKARHFPPEMSIAPIRYEFHQPPLYYLLALPVYVIFGGALLPLRLFSLLLGALLLLVVHETVRIAAPRRPGLAIGTTAVVAFLPMHLAMSAAVNNDVLAELIVGVVLLFAVVYVRIQPGEPPGSDKAYRRLAVLMGITTGLGLVVKSSVYILPAIALAAIAARHLWLEDRQGSIARTLEAAALYLAPALLMALPWWVRNVIQYGGVDFLGLARHGQVVAGQPTTAEFVARLGPGGSSVEFATTTFRSFWGQFGWMGVLLDQRLYQAVALLSVLALAGFVWWAARVWRRRGAVPEWQWAAGGLLALIGLLTLVTFGWYNMSFWQPQGRYLFRALTPAALAITLGWREALRRERALPLAAGLLTAAALLRLGGLLSNWPLFLAVGLAAALAVRRFLPAGWGRFAQTAPYIFLVGLDVASLFWFIVPQLQV
ncbi:MAG: glycosyltransferase family 39 protein, partial [Anaerolineae bacterium]